MSIKGHNSIKNEPKIICNNPILDFVNINAYTKVKFYQFVLKILSRNEIMMDGRNEGWTAQIQYSSPFSKWGYNYNVMVMF